MTEWWKIKGEKVDDAELDKRERKGQISFLLGLVGIKVYAYLRSTDLLTNFFDTCEVDFFSDICRIAFFIIPSLLIWVCLSSKHNTGHYTVKEIFNSLIVPSFVVVVGALVSYYYGYLCLFGKAGRPAEDILCFVLGFLTFLLGVYLCWRNKIFLKKAVLRKEEVNNG